MSVQEELSTARRLLAALDGSTPGYRMIIRDEGRTRREIYFLKREIAFLESVLARGKAADA